MNMIEASRPDKTEQLLDAVLTVIWSKVVLKEYNNLLKGNSAQRRRTGNLVTQAAKHLLENPQGINIAEKEWAINGAEQDAQESQESLAELVRKECSSIIKEKWEDVTPEQLAELVRIYANGDPSKHSAEDLLKSYFKGPKSRNKRIHAYYSFVSGVLDLVGEEDAFKEGMKIALYATDVLPKNPSLIEQAVLLSLAYGEKEENFKKLLIAKRVINRVGFVCSRDIMKYHQENARFMMTNDKAKGEWYRKRKAVTGEIGADAARQFNDAIRGFFQIVDGPLSEEGKQSLKNIWPYNLGFDENDPLNQKLQRALPQLAVPKTINFPKE